MIRRIRHLIHFRIRHLIHIIRTYVVIYIYIYIQVKTLFLKDDEKEFVNLILGHLSNSVLPDFVVYFMFFFYYNVICPEQGFIYRKQPLLHLK